MASVAVSQAARTQDIVVRDATVRPGSVIVATFADGREPVGARARRIHANGDTVVTIGRLPESVLVLEDPNVSRQHAEIRPSGTGFVLADLGSTNGSKVNGIKVSERVLQDGDELTFGATSFRFEAS